MSDERNEHREQRPSVPRPEGPSFYMTTNPGRENEYDLTCDRGRDELQVPVKHPT